MRISREERPDLSVLLNGNATGNAIVGFAMQLSRPLSFASRNALFPQKYAIRLSDTQDPRALHGQAGGRPWTLDNRGPSF
ncbi:hypothetical protein KM043_010314 [Ampulex compressa]|nr:hypothetical protein KM043_010314 [Ampulex compressa]